LKDVGYDTVTIDDCWAAARDPVTKEIIVNGTFPSGMKAMGDYIHSKGLKFGIYSNAGRQTCMKKPGSLGFEAIDAKTYSDWGVDYLKYDTCNTGGAKNPDRYLAMWNQLKNQSVVNRNIVFSINSDWGASAPWTWAEPLAHLWRTTPDITPTWDRWMASNSKSRRSILGIYDDSVGLANYTGPGGWNDWDMLEVGNGLTPSQEQAHFILWAAAKSPLIIGANMDTIAPDSVALLRNREIIAVNQDPLGVPATIIAKDSQKGLETLAGPLSNGDAVIVVLNRGGKTPQTQTVQLSQVPSIGASLTGNLFVRDLLNQKDLPPVTDGVLIATDVPAAGAVMYRVGKTQGAVTNAPTQTGQPVPTGVPSSAVKVAASLVLALLFL
jgi:alpha-galactosidase